MWTPTRRSLLRAAAASPALGLISCRGLTVTPRPWAWAGAVTPRAATVRARMLDGPPVTLTVVPTEGEALPVVSPADVGDAGVATFSLEGLAPDTRYEYRAQDELGNQVQGSFRTFPDGPASFRVCAASCADTASTHPVFDAIRARDPALFLHLGDLHYEDISVADPARFARAYSAVMSSGPQNELYRSCASAYVWDDHDFGANDSDGRSPSRAAALSAYLEHVPHYPLPDGERATTIHQAFDFGRVRFLLSDLRAARDPSGSGGSMLGARQKAWLQQELARAERYALVVWVSSVGWLATGRDQWGGGYPEERAEIGEFLTRNGVSNLLMLSGDAHALAIDDGRNNAWGGFPVFHCAALDRSGSDKGGRYSEGLVQGGGHFGEIDVEDSGGSSVQVTLRGRDASGAVLMEHRFTRPAPDQG